MTGYREHSFDPNGEVMHQRPLRPFDIWQWLGVALGSTAVLIVAADVASRLGLLAQRYDTPPVVVVLLAVGGMLLVNYRRETLPADRLPDSTPARRRVTAVGLGALGVLLAVLAILQGAK